MRILHAALPDDWARACLDGSYDVSTRGRTLVDEGFIHASTLQQLPGCSTASTATSRQSTCW